ncbi:MAG: hypothetical protein ACFFDN_00435 [Candidatus Hodarchaeota archaeon]
MVKIAEIKKEYIPELMKIRKSLKKGIMRKFQFHTISFNYLYEFFLKIGFKEYSHIINNYGRKSHSLRYKDIHILLKLSKIGLKAISIHRDINHHTHKLKHSQIIFLDWMLEKELREFI